jgi:hypothetical protein
MVQTGNWSLVSVILRAPPYPQKDIHVIIKRENKSIVSEASLENA